MTADGFVVVRITRQYHHTPGDRLYTGISTSRAASGCPTGSLPRKEMLVVDQAPARAGSRSAADAPAFESIPAQAEPLDISQDRQWATLAHLGGVAGALPSYLILRMLGDRGPFTRQESREALNHTLLPSIIILACVALALIPAIGWVFAVVAALTWIILAVQSVAAGIKVNQGEPHQYRGNTHLFDKLQSKRAAKA